MRRGSSSFDRKRRCCRPAAQFPLCLGKLPCPLPGTPPRASETSTGGYREAEARQPPPWAWRSGACRPSPRWPPASPSHEGFLGFRPVQAAAFPWDLFSEKGGGVPPPKPPSSTGGHPQNPMEQECRLKGLAPPRGRQSLRLVGHSHGVPAGRVGLCASVRGPPPSDLRVSL